tara:strand:+ start:2145 stop:2318 length:174 start_codon:yes stop_codon:yes gene_type:complete
MKKEKKKICVLCKGPIADAHGHNAEPIKKGRCCDDCNSKVIAERIYKMMSPLYEQLK